MRALALILAGCGLGGGEGGGSANLPVSGAGPYGKLSDPERTTALDEPYVVIDPEADVTDPAPVELEDGTIRIFYTRGGKEIWRADLAGALTEAAVAPTFPEPTTVTILRMRVLSITDEILYHGEHGGHGDSADSADSGRQ